MMRYKILAILLIALTFNSVSFGDGTVTDYVTFTPGAVPGAPAEGMIYYNAADDTFYAYEDGGSWFAIGTEMYQFEPVASPPQTQEGEVYYDSDTDQLFVRTGAAAWEELNGSTLNNTYNQGQSITVDAGAIALGNTEVDGQDTITIANSGAAGTGQALDISDTKTGAHDTVLIDHTAGNASSIILHLRDNAANTTNLAAGIKIESTDATTEIVDAISITATTNAMITDAIDVSDAEITNALNIGANVFTGTTSTFTFTNLTMGSDGDFRLLESGGNSADPDFQVDGYSFLYSGQLGDDASNYVAWDADGVVTYAGNARPTVREWHSVQDLDLVVSGGDGSDATENEFGSTAKYSAWTFAEGTTIAYYSWLIPNHCDVSAAINIYIAWATEEAGGDSCLWRVRHDGGKTFNNDEVPTAPSTVLDTPIPDDTTDTQYEIALTNSGVINSTFTDGELVTFDFYLTDCDTGGAPDYADMIGFIIEYREDNTGN